MLNKPNEVKKWEKKLEEITRKEFASSQNFYKLHANDTLRGVSPTKSPGLKLKAKEAAKNQPGRYSQYAPRKDVHEYPGFWRS